jgi:hypothetical protein
MSSDELKVISKSKKKRMAKAKAKAKDVAKVDVIPETNKYKLMEDSIDVPNSIKSSTEGLYNTIYSLVSGSIDYSSPQDHKKSILDAVSLSVDEKMSLYDTMSLCDKFIDFNNNIGKKKKKIKYENTDIIKLLFTKNKKLTHIYLEFPYMVIEPMKKMNFAINNNAIILEDKYKEFIDYIKIHVYSEELYKLLDNHRFIHNDCFDYSVIILKFYNKKQLRLPFTYVKYIGCVAEQLLEYGDEVLSDEISINIARNISYEEFIEHMYIRFEPRSLVEFSQNMSEKIFNKIYKNIHNSNFCDNIILKSLIAIHEHAGIDKKTLCPKSEFFAYKNKPPKVVYFANKKSKSVYSVYLYTTGVPSLLLTVPICVKDNKILYCINYTNYVYSFGNDKSLTIMVIFNYFPKTGTIKLDALVKSIL